MIGRMSLRTRAHTARLRAPGPSERRRASGVVAASLSLLGALGLSSCTTTLDDGEQGLPRDREVDTTSPDKLRDACAERSDALTLGITKLRRLTRVQLNNTLRDLLGVTSAPASALSPDEKMGPFENNAITAITDLLVQQHQEIAQAVATEVLPRRGEIVSCDLESEGSSCANEFIADFGLKAYRRPLTSEEQAAYLSLYELGASGVDAEHGFRLLIEAFLQAPSFLYRIDTGADGVASSTPVPIDAYSFASRLSYFLWNTMPDAALFAAAADGTLLDKSTLETEIERMLADPRAGETIALFHRQWLGIHALESKSKDPELYPDFGPDMVSAMLEETSRFSDHVIRSGDGLLSTLLTADFSFPSGPLFALYGVAEPPGFTEGQQVSLAGAHRSGILTQPAFLATHAHQDQTSPVHRGIVLRENILCQTIAPPPPGVNNAVPTRTESTTTRERIEQHRANAECASCHDKIDPLGMAFEHYDAIGAYRTTDGLGEVDASGSFTATRADLRGEFQDAVGMTQMLAQASQVEECVANQWFRFALGRVESLDDACSLVDIHDAFKAAGGNVRTLLSLIASSDAFQNVRSSATASTTQETP